MGGWVDAGRSYRLGRDARSSQETRNVPNGASLIAFEGSDRGGPGAPGHSGPRVHGARVRFLDATPRRVRLEVETIKGHARRHGEAIGRSQGAPVEANVES